MVKPMSSAKRAAEEAGFFVPETAVGPYHDGDQSIGNREPGRPQIAATPYVDEMDGHNQEKALQGNCSCVLCQKLDNWRIWRNL